MKLVNQLFFIWILLSFNFIKSQNLLDTSSWTVGSGGVTGFLQNGTTVENSRELGLDHLGNEVILWKASPDSNSNQDGGWNSTYISIDNTKTYRLSVWIKKTNSNDGRTYFGCQQWQPNDNVNPYTALRLNNTVNRNPYFWSGDLPNLDRWYLLVGFIHENAYSSTVSLGKIYDGVTGEAIINMTDYKFTNNTTILRHRAYLYFDTNTSDRQYFYAPRIEVVDSTEWTLDELLSINPDSKLLFAYDNAGNQKQRFYCDVANCIVPTPPAGRVVTEDIVDSKDIGIEEEKETKLEEDIALYPNPTKGIVSIKINSNSEVTLSHSINLYNSVGILVQSIPSESKNEMEIDLTNQSSGMYLVHIHLNNGTSITKQIIKE